MCFVLVLAVLGRVVIDPIEPMRGVDYGVDGQPRASGQTRYNGLGECRLAGACNKLLDADALHR